MSYWSCTSDWCALMWNIVHQCGHVAIRKTQVIDWKSAVPVYKDDSWVLKTAILQKTGAFGALGLEEWWNRADIIEVLTVAKGWSAIPLESMFELSTTKHLRGHKFKLVKHRCNLEVRCNFFTERLINRWNSLDQWTLQVDSVNCFKNHLQLHEEYSLAAQVCTGVPTAGKWRGKWHR